MSAVLRLDKTSVEPGDSIGVEIDVMGDLGSEPGSARFSVAAIDEVATMWRASTSSDHPTATASGWRAELETTWLREGELCELQRVELVAANSEEILAAVEPGSERVFFEGRAAGVEPRSAEAVAKAAQDVEEERERRFAEPVRAAGPGPVREFRVLLFVERLLLKSKLRIPGAELIPLAHGNLSRDEAYIINAVLGELGWDAGVDPQWWADQNDQAKPMVLIRANRVLAVDHDAALVAAQDVRDHLLDLLASRRRAWGQPVGAVVQRLHDVDTGAYGESRIYTEAEGYRGNVVGGFIAGEDPHALLRDYEAVGRSTFASLLVRLFAEAQAEANIDFAYFRYWNLLEIVASRRLPQDSTPVVDFSGSPVTTATGQGVTREGARGRVYELVRDYAVRRQWSEQIVAPTGGSLADGVDGWIARRNRTAHSGGFDPGDSNVSGYAAALRTVQAAQTAGPGLDPYLDALRNAADLVVSVELAIA